MQIDSALLSHPAVVEAVSFGAPNEKYGETVAAAVVLAAPAADPAALIADIKQVAALKLAPFKARPWVLIDQFTSLFLLMYSPALSPVQVMSWLQALQEA